MGLFFHAPKLSVHLPPVDRFFTWISIKKTIQGRPNKCQVLSLGVTIKVIDRSQWE